VRAQELAELLPRWTIERRVLSPQHRDLPGQKIGVDRVADVLPQQDDVVGREPVFGQRRDDGAPFRGLTLVQVDRRLGTLRQSGYDGATLGPLSTSRHGGSLPARMKHPTPIGAKFRF
jgi:hypothetical protein